MTYSFSCKNPGSKFLDIELTIENNDKDSILLQLPAWRPGRYELANFAKNIQKFSVKTMNNKPLEFKKISKDCWEINTHGVKTLKVNYNYYANELNAGSTWVDEQQVYVNPVNCCMYIVGQENQPIRIFTEKTGFKETATSLQKIGNHFVAENFDELADSPIILSNTLQHNSYSVNNTKFNLWFQGECRPPWKKIIKDFKAFTKEQLKVFGEFPFEEYHFLFQILPYQAYHGVEHLKSTVISFGPGYSVFEGENYEEFLGVSSHELFHAWNVKSIRPADMVPYNYTKENYTKMGYLTEGVTTYYGDLMLKRSGVFSEAQFLKQINKTLDRHFWNYGVENMSVTNSSFDTWLDGYERGIPNRKSSIYTEGALLALATDLVIRLESENKKSLDNFMHTLYHEYYLKDKALTEKNYKQELGKLIGAQFKNFWENYYQSPGNYFKLLKPLLKEFGLKLKKTVNPKYFAAHYGIFLQKGKNEIILLAPDSPGAKSGLNPGDEIIAINNIILENGNGDEWAKYFGSNLDLTVKKDGKLIHLTIKASSKSFFPTVRISPLKSISKKQEKLISQWLG